MRAVQSNLLSGGNFLDLHSPMQEPSAVRGCWALEMCSVQWRNWFFKFDFNQLNMNSSVWSSDYIIGHHSCIWTVWIPIWSFLAAADLAGWPLLLSPLVQANVPLANQLHLMLFSCCALVILEPFLFFIYTLLLLSLFHLLTSLPVSSFPYSFLWFSSGLLSFLPL